MRREMGFYEGFTADGDQAYLYEEGVELIAENDLEKKLLLTFPALLQKSRQFLFYTLFENRKPVSLVFDSKNENLVMKLLK
jgi:hypothetical protein